MSARSAKEFEEFFQDCVRLAEQADTPELREKLLNLAREWMRAVMPDVDLSVGGSQVRIISAASPKCGLPNQSHDRSLSC
jgi:hypothetical protein